VTGRPTIVVAEHDGHALRLLSALRPVPAVSLTVGREAEIFLASDPPDHRVSRVALRVTWAAGEWTVEATNRNGVIMHPWGQPAYPALEREVLVGDRIGLRVLGHDRRQHWVLLEHDAELRPADGGGRRTVATELGTSVRPLTPAQLEVVDLLFGEVLAWPPRLDAGVAQLKQVARRAGVSVSAVQARLAEVRSKAEALGLTRQVPLADPEYIYVIARAGFLPRPQGFAAGLPSQS
jgi:hypothetical protein